MGFQTQTLFNLKFRRLEEAFDLVLGAAQAIEATKGPVARRNGAAQPWWASPWRSGDPQVHHGPPGFTPVKRWLRHARAGLWVGLMRRSKKDAEEIFCDIITPGFKFMNIQAMYNFHQLSSLQPSTIDCHLWLILASCTFYHGQVSWTRKLSPRA